MTQVSRLGVTVIYRALYYVMGSVIEFVHGKTLCSALGCDVDLSSGRSGGKNET